MENGSGKIPSDYEAFDRLPPEVREVLRYAPRAFAAATVAASMERHGGVRRVNEFVCHMRAVLERRFPGCIREWDVEYKKRRPA